jgi:hypothetical protein
VGQTRDLYLANGVLTFDFGNGDVSFGAALSPNVWRHIALTYDGTTLRAYVNGGAYGNPQNVSLASVTSAVQVGAWIFGSGNADFLSGTLDEIRVYNRALSAAEVTADMNTAIT